MFSFWEISEDEDLEKIPSINLLILFYRELMDA